MTLPRWVRRESRVLRQKALARGCPECHGPVYLLPSFSMEGQTVAGFALVVPFGCGGCGYAGAMGTHSGAAGDRLMRDLMEAWGGDEVAREVLPAG